MSQEMLFIDEGQSVGVGAHVCAMHENPDGFLGTLARAFLTGLRQNERCAYIGPEVSVAAVRRALGDAGVDVAGAESEGRLVFMTDRDPLLKDGVEFDPDHLLDAIRACSGPPWSPVTRASGSRRTCPGSRATCPARTG